MNCNIYTVTFNPSIDYIVSVDDFRLGRTNRTCSEQMLPGGKGINVSIVLQNLGVQNTAVGFVAGFTGQEIIRLLDEYGVQSDFIRLAQGVSRINMKLQDIDGTEINGRGPQIGEAELAELIDRLDILGEGDVLVLAGSIPASLADDSYCRIMRHLSGRGVKIVVDATKGLLLNVLEYHPFLIKPNHHELGEIFGLEFSTRAEVIPYAKKLREMGACNVLVSMSGEGAVLAAADGQVLEAEAPSGTLVNAVGAGDSMVAGFLAGWLKEQDYSHAFRMGVAAGSATAFSTQLAAVEEIKELYSRIADFKA